MPGALDGIRILEFSEIIAAPFAGMNLADLGAEIIKVEPPGGEPWRLAGQFSPGESRQYIALNRGKRGLAIDLKTTEGQAIVHRLVPSMDVVIVNYRPDTPYNLAIDYETLRALQPRIVYVQNTAFGPKGPNAHRPGYDLVAQAYTGLMASDGKFGETGLPIAMSPPMADFSTGITIVAAVLAGLFVRERTGKGQKIEASLMSTALAVQGGGFMTMEATEGAAISELMQKIREARKRGAPPDEVAELQGDMRRMAANAYYRSYHTADGVIAVACLSPALYGKFTDAVGVPDPRREAIERMTQVGGSTPTGQSLADMQAAGIEFVALCEIRMRDRTTAEWLRTFDEAGVPAGPFRMVDELREDAQIIANDMIVELDHPAAGHMRMAGPLFTMSETPAVIGRPSPLIGEHNHEVLHELGYSHDEIVSLDANGIIRTVPKPERKGSA